MGKYVKPALLPLLGALLSLPCWPADTPSFLEPGPSPNRSPFWEEETPLEISGLWAGSIAGTGIGMLLGIGIGPLFAHECGRDDDACHDAWFSPEAAAALVGGMVGAELGHGLGLHAAGKFMHKRGNVFLTLLETAAWDATAFAASFALYAALDSPGEQGGLATGLSRTAFIGIASLMPCLTFAYIDYRIRFPLSFSVSPAPRPEGGFAERWRLNLIQIVVTP